MHDVIVGGWRIRSQENLLSRRGKQIELQPRCMQLLSCLIERSNQIVTREELMQTVWSGRIVGEDAINNCVARLRRAIDDNPRRPSIVETVPGRGYRLRAEVQHPTSRRWTTLVAGIILSTGAVALAHDRISIYRFADGASSEQRAKTMQRMIDDIGGSAHHAMAIRLHGVDSKEEIALASTASDE